MLVNADAKALEWVCAALLSQDPTAMREITNGEDQHSANQEAFGLPSRLIAKKFLFRVIYGGTGSGFANDPDFGLIGNADFWDKVIEAFYKKYPGMHTWHIELMNTVLTTGQTRIPTGRTYLFPANEVAHNPKFWRPKILNYSVQGLGAELMAISRRNLWLLLSGVNPRPLLIDTVHDSIVLDTLENEWYNISKILEKAFKDVPSVYETMFSSPFQLPMRAEISYGRDWKNMTEIEFND